MKFKKMTLEECYTLIKTKRFTINPNIGFIKQLMNYENELFSIQTINYEEYVTQFFLDDLKIEKEEFQKFVKLSIEKVGQDPKLLLEEISNRFFK
jgi:hypothetical protein